MAKVTAAVANAALPSVAPRNEAFRRNRRGNPRRYANACEIRAVVWRAQKTNGLYLWRWCGEAVVWIMWTSALIRLPLANRCDLIVTAH
jgi:hypothetical protein